MAFRTALVTGANRGIGLEVCRQLGHAGFHVVLTARDAVRGRQAARRLAHEGVAVRHERLDVTLEASVNACVSRLRKAGVRVDVLVNNAGTYERTPLLRADTPAVMQSLRTHVLGAWWLSRALLPGMNRRGYGRIVNVSSGYGAFGGALASAPPVYGISKAALNALTVKLAQETRGNVKVNAADPGWVRTRMGGAAATSSVEEGAATIVWLATLPDDGPSGGFFRQRKPAHW